MRPKTEYEGPNDRMPSMFGLVFLVAVYIFVRVEKVDVAVIEKGVPAVTTPQSSQCAMEVLLNRANERELGEGLCLGIAGEKQLYNAALAVQLVRIWLQEAMSYVLLYSV
nr:hypothetical protein BaRGS_034655 [Batillaria attramentaria]